MLAWLTDWLPGCQPASLGHTSIWLVVTVTVTVTVRVRGRIVIEVGAGVVRQYCHRFKPMSLAMRQSVEPTVRPSVSQSVCQSVNHNPFQFAASTNQTRYRSKKIYGTNKIYSAQPQTPTLPLAQVVACQEKK